MEGRSAYGRDVSRSVPPRGAAIQGSEAQDHRGGARWRVEAGGCHPLGKEAVRALRRQHGHHPQGGRRAVGGGVPDTTAGARHLCRQP